MEMNARQIEAVWDLLDELIGIQWSMELSVEGYEDESEAKKKIESYALLKAWHAQQAA